MEGLNRATEALKTHCTSWHKKCVSLLVTIQHMSDIAELLLISPNGRASSWAMITYLRKMRCSALLKIMRPVTMDDKS